ncbi:hypothetical protein TREES_T100000424 [Tupaia chinensis]|uniref:Uncharacterized protein n=1 Tax=Tupaia chinensis TaxID=246437 RepID=L9KUM3_TUPCH|nr:hypothetical protein TREES_T100000424 [Tupaia chinensis]
MPQLSSIMAYPEPVGAGHLHKANSGYRPAEWGKKLTVKPMDMMNITKERTKFYGLRGECGAAWAAEKGEVIKEEMIHGGLKAPLGKLLVMLFPAQWGKKLTMKPMDMMNITKERTKFYGLRGECGAAWAAEKGEVIKEEMIHGGLKAPLGKL